jgi:hypothetical protein
LTNASNNGFECASKHLSLRPKSTNSSSKFDNLLDKVLNGTFHMLLPSTFKKVSASTNTKKEEGMNYEGGKRGKEARKKCRNEN